MVPNRTKAITYYRSNGHPILRPQSTDFNQRDVIEDYAEKNNIQIVETFASCSKRYASNELQRACYYCKLHEEVRYLLVSDFSRISRNVDDFMAWRAAFEACDVTILPVLRPTENSPAGKFMEAMHVTLAQMENIERSERVKQALRRKKEMQK